VPEQSQQETLRRLGDDEVRRIVDRYVDAWERGDVAAFAALLADEATFNMPPLSTWFAGRDAIAVWAAREPMNGSWRWRILPTRANGQLALGYYCEDGQGGWVPFALNVLALRGHEIGAVTAFIARPVEDLEADAQQRLPDQPVHARLAQHLFVRFGLPEHLDR
jgi:RNA polymerase sigma-70 factor, ECF subfamily